MATANKWLTDVDYPELWEAIDEALILTAACYPESGLLAERWVSLPKRVRAHLHGQLRAALRRRMRCHQSPPPPESIP
jgi:hypothetical protein